MRIKTHSIILLRLVKLLPFLRFRCACTSCTLALRFSNLQHFSSPAANTGMGLKFIFLMLPLMLAGCYSNSDIQAKYARYESECRRFARDKVEEQAESADKATTSSVAGKAFSECMTEKGWKVATPKPTNTAQNTTPPIGPSTSGGVPGGTASGTAARAAPGATSLPPPPMVSTPTVPAPTGAVSVPTAPSTPMNMPGNAARTTTVQPRVSVDPSWSTYQPARPSGTPAPDYGRGAGRNF